MGNGHNKKDDDADNNERKDLTRIENLTEFLHEVDPDLESKFTDFKNSYQRADGTNTSDTGDEIAELDDSSDSPPEIPEIDENPPDFNLEESNSEITFSDESAFLENESSSVEFSFEDSTSEELNSMPAFDEDFSNEESSIKEMPNEHRDQNFTEISAPPTLETTFDFAESSSLQENLEPIIENELPDSYQPSERFDDVKTFAQNFSYGQIQGGGNPPFSVILRNLKYEDDKESILSLLSEFGITTEENFAETQKALEMGSLLIPQISEYSAIVLTHKLRRFDCDLEVGLSDEVHPSRSGEHNPKGLVKRESLKQNISESYKKDNNQKEIRDIIVSTTPYLDGYIINKYIGIQTSFAIVDEEELKRIKFVQQQARRAQKLEDYNVPESDELSSEQAFLDYKSSFDYLFISLLEELKSKAQKEKANVLLGLNYQLQLLPFEKTTSGKNCYQLTASATMAVVSPE